MERHMATTKRPEFLDLPKEDGLALLGRAHVGRLAFTFHDRVDIEPISYVFENDWIYGRTSTGTKLATVKHHPWVAFEVDEIEGPFDWRSVVIHGTLYLLADTGSERDRDLYQRALAALRTRDAEVLTERDPAPHRTHVFGIHIDD